MSPTPAVGFVVRPEHPPQELPELARRVEAAGFDELWLWEDCFLAGGIAASATALAATERIRVGLGIMPAPVRNPVFAAMEIAALARLHPGRFMPGFGHGLPDWMRQVGAMPQSPLTLLEETVSAVRALLAGEEVSVEGRYVRIRGVRLDHPPDEVPPVLTGVRRERSLALSGRVADGTILSEPSAVEYVEWARERIAATRPHRLVVYEWCAVADDPAAARAALRPLLLERIREGGPQLEALGPPPDDPPDDWIDRMTICGTPAGCAARIEAIAAAGADAVVLVPPDASVGPEELARVIS